MNGSIIFLVTLMAGAILKAAETPPPVGEQLPGQEAPAAMTWRPSSLPEDQGITTTSGDYRGNWVLKREIARQARQVYELVRAAALVVDAVKKDFLAARTQTEAQLNVFYTDIGYQEGEIDERIAQLTQEVEQKKEQEAALTEEEQRFLAEINEKKNELEQAKKDLAIVQELDASLNKAFAVALEQIELARSYEQRAWENYDKISEVLSDEIAERLYLEIQGFKSNVDSITYYLNQELLTYLESTKNKLQEQMLKLKEKIADLKARGVLLEKNIEQFEAQKQKPVPPKEIKRMWYQQIFYAISYPFVYVYDVVKSALSGVYHLFVSKKKESVESVPAGKLTPVEMTQAVPAVQAGLIVASTPPSLAEIAQTVGEHVPQEMTAMPEGTTEQPLIPAEVPVPSPVPAAMPLPQMVEQPLTTPEMEMQPTAPLAEVDLQAQSAQVPAVEQISALEIPVQAEQPEMVVPAQSPQTVPEAVPMQDVSVPTNVVEQEIISAAPTIAEVPELLMPEQVQVPPLSDQEIQQ